MPERIYEGKGDSTQWKGGGGLRVHAGEERSLCPVRTARLPRRRTHKDFMAGPRTTWRDVGAGLIPLEVASAAAVAMLEGRERIEVDVERRSLRFRHTRSLGSWRMVSGRGVQHRRPDAPVRSDQK